MCIRDSTHTHTHTHTHVNRNSLKVTLGTETNSSQENDYPGKEQMLVQEIHGLPIHENTSLAGRSYSSSKRPKDFSGPPFK